MSQYLLWCGFVTSHYCLISTALLKTDLQEKWGMHSHVTHRCYCLVHRHSQWSKIPEGSRSQLQRWHISDVWGPESWFLWPQRAQVKAALQLGPGNHCSTGHHIFTHGFSSALQCLVPPSDNRDTSHTNSAPGTRAAAVVKHLFF